jgi:hypothetical protein
MHKVFDMSVSTIISLVSGLIVHHDPCAWKLGYIIKSSQAEDHSTYCKTEKFHGNKYMQISYCRHIRVRIFSPVIAIFWEFFLCMLRKSFSSLFCHYPNHSISWFTLGMRCIISLTHVSTPDELGIRKHHAINSAHQPMFTKPASSLNVASQRKSNQSIGYVS